MTMGGTIAGTIVQLLSFILGVMVLQTFIYWIAHTCPPLKSDHISPQPTSHPSGSDSSTFLDVVRPRRSDSTSAGLATEELEPDPIQHRKSSFRPLSVAHHAFVLFSTYRYSLQTFFVLGSTSVIVREFQNDLIVYHCEWVPSNGSQFQFEKSITTDAQMLYFKFHENNETYGPAVVNCTFNQAVGEDNSGGLLRLNISKVPCFWIPCAAVETVFEEKPSSVRSEFLEVMNESKFQHEYAFCGPAIWSSSRLSWIQIWLEYHNFIWHGRAHFYFYDIGGMDDAKRELLAPWIKSGLITIIDAYGEEAYPAWYRNQLLFLNDCLYRTRFTSRWVFFHDLDEFLHIPAPNTLDSLLGENADVPWMSLASMPVSLQLCRQNRSEDEWPLERMLWRAKQPACSDPEQDPWLCLIYFGRRKLVVNPRKVMMVGVHGAVMPESGGIDFNGSIARVNHYQGAVDPRLELCSFLVSNSSDPEWLQFDDSIASIVPTIRNFTTTSAFS